MASRPSLQVDHEDLADALQVLASATRLDILMALRLPRAVRDIEVQPRRSRPGEDPDRNISVPATRQHLAKLLEAGLVTAEVEVGKEAGDSRRYVVNRPRLYALAQGFLQLSALQGRHAPATDATMTMGPGAPAVEVKGPRLTLVMGAYEGKSYALNASTAAGHAWTIGRRAGLPVSLDYDPFVSREHALVAFDGHQFVVRDAEGSHNGTWVNWRLLGEGEECPLRSGDVVGVGRSLLVFSDT